MFWTHIILEAYCMRKVSDAKCKHRCKWLKNGSFEKIENEDYDPNYRVPRKPGYCKSRPNYVCLENDCPHLAYTDAEESDYKFLYKKYKKKPKSTGKHL